MKRAGEKRPGGKRSSERKCLPPVLECGRVVGMKIAGGLALCWMVAGWGGAAGQTPATAADAPTEQSIAAKLQAAPFLMLRGMWDGDKLSFDAQGGVAGSPQRRLFSLSAVVVTQVHLSDSSLEIDGERAGLVMQPAQSLKKAVRAVALGKHGKEEAISIMIPRGEAHPDALEAAVEKVVSVGIDDGLMATAPSYWHVWLRHELHPELPPLAMPAGVYGPPGEPFGRGTLSAIRAPVLIYGPDPKFTPEARERGYQGVSLIGLIVDAQGRPASEWIEEPIGMGLDEAAIAAVTQYRFKPATLHGTPVAVRINIEVNHRIY